VLEVFQQTLFMNFDSMLGGDLEFGLKKLKMILENEH